jgi:hypothetical protein
MPNRPAWKRYQWRMLWCSLLYAIFLIAAVYGFKHQLLHGPSAYVAAILPALPVIVIFAAIGRYLVEEEDEYIRLLMVRQTLWAGAFVLSVATIYGFLESFDLVRHVEAYYIVIVWIFGQAVGAAFNKLTVGETGAQC